MFWMFKRSRFTDSAVAFFNSINNNHSTGNAAGASKKSGYNKLSSGEDASADHKNANLNNLVSPLTSSVHGGGGGGVGESSESSSASDFDLEEEDEFSDDSEYDEALTCNVCDRSFSSARALSQHQQKKRHFGCSACDSLFQTLMALEHHKEEFEHWSGDESMLVPHHHSDDSSEETSEEMERLL
ncbi:dnaJ homolog subfamily C member 21 [Macrosteles quadrilineatus]|uniref:dnaJ homolog subfamily C member 21 n=1 Tax=Macrosteles quadrilineatus TaxID=74068 RepID=UPI0023E148F7|nr:dnaJ homolog subfamily C member 21 [Macrosteles quadrilineatus]